MAWWSLKTLFCCCCFFLGKRVLEPFLLSDLPCLEGLQINRCKKEMKTIVDFSCGKYQHRPVSLLTPTATCLLELSSYVVSLHWGKAWLRRILKWANAESRWQTLAAMISSLIICTACCGRRPGRPANRRAQEGRESVLSHLRKRPGSPWRRQYQSGLPTTHIS